MGRASVLGFTDVLTALAAEKSSWYAGDEAVLDQVATKILPGLAKLPSDRP